MPSSEDLKKAREVKKELAEQARMTPEQREAERRAHMQAAIEGGKPKLTEEERRQHEETERLRQIQERDKQEGK